ncbi:E3 SUMO-protein ligase ZBED1-like [Bombina bombina]|uniref:E3 SUMO-protein ligase ZBED1-like n=1 Tax=Bombina bombina TaxID=8345 RepID=UPI00235B008A|nr:E3 SUMO-protein ligase ZBED1-like [Bombina bombina]
MTSSLRRKREAASLDSTSTTLVDHSKSKVWNYYTKLGDTCVECNVCRKQMSFHNNTTCMREHLVKRHSILDAGFIKIKEGSKKELPSLEGSPKRLRQAFPERELCEARTEVISELVLEMIFRDLHSFSLVEDKGFSYLIAYLEPGFSFPSPLQLSSMLWNKYNLVKQQVQYCLQTASSVVLSIESWTSLANQPCMSITANFIDGEWRLSSYMLETHHLNLSKTEDSLAERLCNVLVEFGLSMKAVSCIVHGHSPSLLANAQSLKVAHTWTSLCCAANILQLCVRAGLEIQEVQEALGSARGLVRHFQQDLEASCLLNAKLEAMNKPRLVLDKDFCWITTLEMCEGLLDLKWAILSVIEDQAVQDITEQHWKLLQDLVPILRTIRIATAFLQEQQNSSVSSLMPCIHGILTALGQFFEDSSGIVKSVAGKIRSEICRHWELLDEEKMLTNPAVIASFLDPRFKELRFLKPRARGELHTQMRNVLSQTSELPSSSRIHPLSLLCYRVSGGEEASVQCDKARGAVFEDMYDFLLGKDPTESMPEVQQQLENYIVEPICKRTTDPLIWWKENHNRFPALAKLACQYLAVPVTVVKPERAFAAKPNLMDQRRAALDPRFMNQILFLHQNVDLLKLAKTK